MPDRYIDPAPHTMLAASVIAIVNSGCLETVKYGYYGDTVNFFAVSLSYFVQRGTYSVFA